MDSETCIKGNCSARRSLAPSANAFDPAIECYVRWIPFLLNGDVGGGLRRNWHGAFRCAMMRSSNDGMGRTECDHHDRQKRWGDRSHATRRFSARSLPRFGTTSKVTLAPSASDVKPVCVPKTLFELMP